jgi:hypothetical protein
VEPKSPSGIRILFRKITMGAVVWDVRTIFEKKNDATVYIPTFATLQL